MLSKHRGDAEEGAELVANAQRGVEEVELGVPEPAGGGCMEKLLQPPSPRGEEEAAAGRPPEAGEASEFRAPLEVHDAVAFLRRWGVGAGLRDFVARWLYWVRGGMGNRNLLGTWCFIFCVFSARIVLVPLWNMPFIPILSPVFGHGPRWASSKVLSAAILTHVVCGVAMLCCATLQLDAHVRRSSAALHRTLGYLYVVFGIGCLSGLQFLSEGLTKQHGLFATFLMELTAVLWVGFTYTAVKCARCRDFESHKRWMLRSLAAGLSPLVQRGANYALVAAALTVRFVASALYGESCFAARWPVREASAWDFVSGPGEIAGPIAEIRAQHAGGGGDAGKLIDESFPRVLSWTGYGVAEAFVAPLSSLAGILIVLLACELQAFVAPLSSLAGILIVLLACELQTQGAISKATSLGLLREVVHTRAWSEMNVFAKEFWRVFTGDKVHFLPETLPGRRFLALLIHVGVPILCMPFFLLALAIVAAATAITIVVVAVAFVVIMWFFENLIALVLSVPVYLCTLVLRIAAGESLASVAESEISLPPVPSMGNR